jgi:hypothetical protein
VVVVMVMVVVYTAYVFVRGWLHFNMVPSTLGSEANIKNWQ